MGGEGVSRTREGWGWRVGRSPVGVTEPLGCVLWVCIRKSYDFKRQAVRGWLHLFLAGLTRDRRRGMDL